MTGPQVGLCRFWGRGVNHRDRVDRREENHRVSEIPRKAVQRTAKLASLPLGVAGRVVGEGFHRGAGHPHAEVEALEAATATDGGAVGAQPGGGR